MSASDSDDEWKEYPCEECGEATNPNRDGARCGRCEEPFCHVHFHGIEAKDYIDVYLNYDFLESVFCKSCTGEMKQECLDATPEERAQSRRAYQRDQQEAKRRKKK